MSFIGSYFEIILVILTIGSLVIILTDSFLKKKYIESNKGNETVINKVGYLNIRGHYFQYF